MERRSNKRSVKRLHDFLTVGPNSLGSVKRLHDFLMVGPNSLGSVKRLHDFLTVGPNSLVRSKQVFRVAANSIGCPNTGWSEYKAAYS